MYYVLRNKDIRYVFGNRDSCNCRMDGYTNPLHCYPNPPDTDSKPDKSSKKHKETSAVDSSPPQMCFSPTMADAVIGATSGTYTTCCDTFPDATNNDLSNSCGSNLQGSNRLQRGLNYMYYLEDYYRRLDTSGAENSYQSVRSNGKSANSGAKQVPFHPVYQIVPDLQHDLVAFYSAEIVQQWMLELPEIVPPKPHSISMRSLFTLNTLLLIVLMGGLVLYLWLVRWWFMKREQRGKNGANKPNNNRNVTKLNDEPNEATFLL